MKICNYLILDKDDFTEVCGVISRKEAIKEMGQSALNRHLLNGVDFPFRGKYILVEDIDFHEKETFEEIKIADGKKGTYYASRNGEFFIKYNDGTTKYLKKFRESKNGYVVVSINKRNYRAKNLIAKLFIKDFKRNDVVLQKNKDIFDCSVENLKVIPRSLHSKKNYALARAKKVGLYENNKLVRTWPSARKCANDMFCSYQIINKICNGKTNTKLFDVRWM